MIAGGRKMIGFFLAAVMMFSLVALMLMEALPAQAAANDIAYIYDTDVASADSYKALLEANGYVVTKVHMDDVATTDFSTYGLVIVGPDTGDWEDADSVSVVAESTKPIIGLGVGGYRFFGQLDLDIGYPNGATDSASGVYVVDALHAIFNAPNAITIPLDSIIELYTTSVDLKHIHLGTSIPPDVVVLGRHPNTTGYYPLVQEGDRYLLWGFQASPDTMTQEGKDLFVNVVNHLFALPPDAAFIGDPTTGTAPLTVQFTDQSTGDVTSWAWDFDYDGEVDSYEQNPSHTYNTTGSYTVSLKVTGPGGYSLEVKGDYITVSSGGLSGGAIAGIVVGSLVAAGLIAYFLIRRWRAAGKRA